MHGGPAGSLTKRFVTSQRSRPPEMETVGETLGTIES